MKPTSIVFLVIAVLLVIGGMITCSVAKDIALTDNYALFHETEDGGTYLRYDFSAAEISKIELLITDAEVNVIPGAETSYIEFINFRDGLYTLSTSGKVVSMDEIPDLKSIFSFQSGFSFSGMRYILRSGTVSLGEKKVNIHLSPDTALKILSIKADSCVLNAEGISTSFDIQMDIAGRAEASLTEVRTACALEIEAAEVALQLDRCNFHTVGLTATAADVMADALYWDSMSLHVQTGNVTLISVNPLTMDQIYVGGSGRLTVEGADMPLPHRPETADSLGNMLNAHIGTAALTLSGISETEN